MPNPNPAKLSEEMNAKFTREMDEIMEKQASSEIAQSRERFEKWAISRGLKPERWIPDPRVYVHTDMQDRWMAWQAAERDTRERVAQEVEEKWRHPQAKWIAAQIRGKE